jgi:Family of unknown function (DUF6444)
MDSATPLDGIRADEWAATLAFMQHALGALLSFGSQQQLAHLQARLAELEARLNQHSQNSSKPHLLTVLTEAVSAD